MAASMLSFAGKVALVTGASTGIGASCAILFAKLGANLIITGRNEAGLMSVKDECLKQSYGQEPLVLLGDVAKEADCENIVKSAVEKFKRIDILVNNAGIMEYGSIETTSLEQYDNVMNVNARAVYHMTMLCVPHLLKTKGNIVNVSSVCGTRSFPGVLAYCISKSAVDQLTSCVALELAAKGVRVNSVNPGVILTGLQKKSGLSDEEYAKFLEKSKTTHPIGRPGLPEEVANTIAFLASDMASDITGEHIHVDGGRHAACPR